MNVLGIAGSLRKDSMNKKLLVAIAGLLPDGSEYIAGNIAMPLYNQDDEREQFPAEAHALKDAIRAADAIIIASPEYNRSIPGPLKNALDWTSRPYGQSAWQGKPVLIAGASGGSIGTALAHYDLAKVLSFSGARVSPAEVLIGSFNERFDAEGHVADPKTREVLDKAVADFLAFAAAGR